MLRGQGPARPPRPRCARSPRRPCAASWTSPSRCAARVAVLAGAAGPRCWTTWADELEADPGRPAPPSAPSSGWASGAAGGVRRLHPGGPPAGRRGSALDFCAANDPSRVVDGRLTGRVVGEGRRPARQGRSPLRRFADEYGNPARAVRGGRRRRQATSTCSPPPGSGVAFNAKARAAGRSPTPRCPTRTWDVVLFVLGITRGRGGGQPTPPRACCAGVPLP